MDCKFVFSSIFPEADIDVNDGHGASYEVGLFLSPCSVDLTDADAQGEAEILPWLFLSELTVKTLFASDLGVLNVFGVGQISSRAIRVKGELPSRYTRLIVRVASGRESDETVAASVLTCSTADWEA